MANKLNLNFVLERGCWFGVKNGKQTAFRYATREALLICYSDLDYIVRVIYRA